MPANRIDAAITPAQRTAIAGAVRTIRDNLPFLLGLTLEEREELNKLGVKSRAFAETALEVAQQNPTAIPAALNVADYEEDLALYAALEEPLRALEQLVEEVSDTRMLAGSEAMGAARAVYYYVKGQPAGSRLDEAVRTLGLRFERPRRVGGGGGTGGDGGGNPPPV